MLSVQRFGEHAGWARTTSMAALAIVAISHGTAFAGGFADCPQFFVHSPPAITGFGKLRELCFSEFAVLHSGETKTPIYVAQRLNSQALEDGHYLKRSNRFYPEARLPAAERSDLQDFKNSGWSRGHMAPAGDMATAEGKAQSFSLANVVPQDALHNSGAWSKIEQDTRRYVRRAKGYVFIITGPLFDGASQRIGPDGVLVPTGIFKMVNDPIARKCWVHIHQNDFNQQAVAPQPCSNFLNNFTQ